MRKAMLLLVIMAMVIIPVAAYADFDWCGHQDIMFWNASSDISGYRVIDHVPERAVMSSIISPSVISTSGEKTLGTWLTQSFEDQTIIAPGRWIFRTYMVASSDSGTTSIHYRLFNRSSDGTITFLFFGKAISEDVNQGTIPSEYNLYYARRNVTTLFPGDRLGIQINVSTDSAASRTVTMYVGGNTNASYVSSGYWLCSALEDNGGSSDADGGAIAIAFGIAGGIIGAIIIIRRKP